MDTELPKDAPKDTPEARRYHREFVRHARAMLPDDTFESLHRKARGSAGGLAPRTPKENPEPIDKAQAGFFEGMRAFWQSMFGPTEPLSLPAPKEPPEDVYYTIYAEAAEAIDKEIPTASDVHVPVPIGAVKPFPKTKGKRNEGTKRRKKKKADGTVPPPKGTYVNKTAEPLYAVMAEVEKADGIESPTERRGIAVHLNGETPREPGFLAARNSSEVLPDGCAEVVLIRKARGPKHRRELVAEAKRLLIPEGRILSEEPLGTLLGDDLERQLEFKHMLKVEKADWSEEDHPRDDAGRFGGGAGKSLGKTGSGKTIYADGRGAERYSKQDHADAKDAHNSESERIMTSARYDAKADGHHRAIAEKHGRAALAPDKLAPGEERTSSGKTYDASPRQKIYSEGRRAAEHHEQQWRDGDRQSTLHGDASYRLQDISGGKVHAAYPHFSEKDHLDVAGYHERAAEGARRRGDDEGYLSHSGAQMGHLGAAYLSGRKASKVEKGNWSEKNHPRDERGADLDEQAVKKAAPEGLVAVLTEVKKHKPGAEAGRGAEALGRMTEERRKLIVKSLDRELPIAGLNRKRQLIYAPALVPNEVHHSHDWMSPEDIEYSAHKYMTGARAIGAEHRGAIDAECVESFIAPQDLDFSGEYESPYGETKIPKGSWMVTIHVKDKNEWAKVERGEYTGISVGGFGLREALQND